MKPTHIGKLEDGTPKKLTESLKFWINGKQKYRKENGSPVGKTDEPYLVLESIESLPTKVLLEAPNGTMYTLVSSNTKADTMVLRNADGMEFTTHISKATGYKAHKIFD